MDQDKMEQDKVDENNMDQDKMTANQVTMSEVKINQVKIYQNKLSEEEHLHSRLKTKGKTQTYLIQPDVLQLMPRKRQGKCVGASLKLNKAEQRLRTKMELSQKSKQYNNISSDIWSHLANYIPPEDIKRYALICRHSAYSLISHKFWFHVYRKYCQRSTDGNNLILELPDYLQMDQLTACDVYTLRQRVIQALFYCHTRFAERLKIEYKLEILVGRNYVSCWHLQMECVWTMCYKFRLNFPLRNNSDNNTTSLDTSTPNEDDLEDVVHDWESLVEDDISELLGAKSRENSFSKITRSAQEDNEGVCLLLIYCNRFIPFPFDFLYANSTSVIRLAAARESKDHKDLEIDLVSFSGDERVKWEYNEVLNWKVLPWWHTDFSRFNKT